MGLHKMEAESVGLEGEGSADSVTACAGHGSLHCTHE